MNLCDPYHISIAEVPEQDYKQGFCQNKQDLVSISIQGFNYSINVKGIAYSFIGEDFEFNLWAVNGIQLSNARHRADRETDFDAEHFPLYAEFF